MFSAMFAAVLATAAVDPATIKIFTDAQAALQSADAALATTQAGTNTSARAAAIQADATAITAMGNAAQTYATAIIADVGPITTVAQLQGELNTGNYKPAQLQLLATLCHMRKVQIQFSDYAAYTALVQSLLPARKLSAKAPAKEIASRAARLTPLLATGSGPLIPAEILLSEAQTLVAGNDAADLTTLLQANLSNAATDQICSNAIKAGVLAVAAPIVQTCDVAWTNAQGKIGLGAVLRNTTVTDPLRMTVRTAQQFLNDFKQQCRQTTGVVPQATIQAIINKTVNGTGAMDGTVSTQAQTFGSLLTAGTWQAAMWAGDFPTAAKLAYASMKAAGSDAAYAAAVKQLEQAVLCNDQCYNLRAIAVVQWCNGDLTSCPVADLLGIMAQTARPKKAP